jgi:membrane associated rhomboid family serine protease
MIPLRDDIPSRRPSFVNYTIIALNIMIFFVQLGLSKRQLEAFILTFGFIPGRFLSQIGEADILTLILPIFTSMFLHGGWLHIISNMWILFIFGDNVEDTFGHGRFLLFYLGCGVVACFAQLAVAPHSSLPMVGASGAIAGVMGAYFALFPHARVLTLVPIVFFVIIEVPAYVYLGLWFFLQLYAGALTLVGPEVKGGVAFWAHVGGFAAGLVIVLLLLPNRFLSGRRPG